MIAISSTAAAEEGMWTLDQLARLDLGREGLEIDASEIYDPNGKCLADASVLLGGGTSAFVSPTGLMLTNHHVAYGAVQRASTRGVDYLTDGFLARSHGEEIQAPGVSAEMIVETRDVTEGVLAAARGIEDAVERQRKIDGKIREMTEEIEEGGEDVSARIAAMYYGAKYVLYIYKRFDDVRIVYMPPLAIGNYGGDVDNWMWPRHTGDFAFARAYVSPGGVGRKYHPDNVPYAPETWLQVSAGDLDEGDFAFTLGFPGRTSRFRTSHSASYWKELYLPDRLRLFDDILAALDEAAGADPTAQMKVAGRKKGIANVQKNWGGMLEAMERTDFVDEKRRQEKELMEFIEADEGRAEKYGDVLESIADLYDRRRDLKDRDDALGLFDSSAGLAADVASYAVYAAMEREKPEEDRDPQFSESDVERAVFRLESRYMTYYEPMERWGLEYSLEKADALPDGRRIAGLDYILEDSTKGIDEWVDSILEGTRLADVEFAESLFEMTPRELEGLDDPLLDLALALYPETDEMRERDEKFGARITELRRKYNEALLLWKGGVLYPDANRTLRFSHGSIKGYRPGDAVSYLPFTSLSGVIDKDTGEPPFDAPGKLKELYETKDFGRWADPELGDVPVAFLVDCDGTGGSSGSPVLNAEGHMIGIAFDGVLEARLGDWKFEPALSREICVDIRYVLFVTERHAGAGFLLDELGIPE